MAVAMEMPWVATTFREAMGRREITGTRFSMQRSLSARSAVSETAAARSSRLRL
jgi:hypothetical protein